MKLKYGSTAVVTHLLERKNIKYRLIQCHDLGYESVVMNETGYFPVSIICTAENIELYSGDPEDAAQVNVSQEVTKSNMIDNCSAYITTALAKIEQINNKVTIFS